MICPTVTAYTTEEYKLQMNIVCAFASRVHVDLGDGTFATKTISIEEAWWPESLTVDVHLMYNDPMPFLPQLVSRKPYMVILHAEASGDVGAAIDYLKANGVRVGLALQQSTTVESVRAHLPAVDHVLLFSGTLGSFGGVADMSLLRKVEQVHAQNPDAEIGWDGGVSTENAKQLADGGVDVLNVGGAIHKASHPENVYRDLQRLAIATDRP